MTENRAQPMDAAPALTVRRMALKDADEVADLSVQLGYEATPAEMQERISDLAGASDSQAAFVAYSGSNNQIVGWIEVSITRHLQSAPFAMIGGLVVKDGVRGLGIGKRLCDEAELWSRAQGVGLLRVTSRSTRPGAHRFYLREGFTEVKVSKVFDKRLD